jgi:GDPmannose 4,6-dehydratase
MATALVTGVTGQLGYYVAECLQRRGDLVWGLVRQSTLGRGADARALPYRPITGDLLDEYSMASILEEVRPDRLFNFGAQSFIPASWTQPILTAQYTGLGVVRLLEAVRRAVPACRVLQAGSSELFADADRSPQDEDFPIRPLNPYGIAKAFAFHSVRAYRNRYGQFGTNVIFYTNESLRRSPEFVFRKVTRGVAEVVAGKAERISLGNLETVRDWGYAPEYAALSVALLDLDRPDDFVIATGDGHTVRELVSRAFQLVGLDWEKYVNVDTTLVRQSEQVPMVGNCGKLERVLGQRPRVKFDLVLRILLAEDLRALGCEVPFEHPDPVQVVAGAGSARRRDQLPSSV